MRKTMKRFVAVLLAAVTVSAPAKVWAEDMDKYCSTYDQVESNATGGDYVGGRLVYETMGTVQRNPGSTTTTITTSTSGSVGVSGTTASTTTTVANSTTSGSTIVTTSEPIGIYAMNDGSIYEINCVTGEFRLISSPKK